MPGDNVELTDADIANNEGSRLFDLGRFEEGLVKFREAKAIDPKHPHAHCNLIFSADYGPERGFAYHQQLRREFAASLDPVPLRVHKNDLGLDRKLRIGYVSPDIRNHSALACFGPILRNHDRAKFEVYCYSDTHKPDEATDSIREIVDMFRDTHDLANAELDAVIEADQIDILVDLAGYSAFNRLKMFHRKPAPIQVTAWGHGGGTGLAAMDYHFADTVSIPDHARGLCAEEILDLPCIITFEIPDFNLPIQRPPHEENGYWVFGNLGKLAKVNPMMQGYFASVLASVPKSRLLLKDTTWENPAVNEPFFELLASHGVSSYRVTTRGRTSKLQHNLNYSEIDYVLDTWPQNGGITTCEALWMGCPVLTRLGDQLSSRVSAAILTALDLQRFICPPWKPFDEFVADTIRWEDLTRFRRTIRDTILSSGIGNAKLYVGAVEDHYQKIWGEYVGTRS